MDAVNLTTRYLKVELADFISLLPYLPAILLLYYLIKALTNTLIDHATSDITKIPEPYLPPHKRYSVGHNILKLILINDPIDTARLYNDWRREHGTTYQLRSTFGERIVYVTSDTAMRQVNVSNSSAFSKTSATRATISALVGRNGILLAEGQVHARLRRAVSPAMHHQALLNLGHIFLEHGHALTNRISGRAVTDILREVRMSTFAVIFETCFGKQRVSEQEFDKIREAYLVLFLEPPGRSAIRILLTKFLWFVDSTVFQYRYDLKEYLQKTIFQLCKTSAPCGRNTLLNLMIDATTEKKLAYQEMVETVSSFLVAGQVTTSISVCWTLYLLARHPEWQDYLVEELKNWSEGSGLAELDELPLLNRVIRESLRLYPPVVSIGRTANEPAVIDGYRLPKGTQIRMPILAMHRSQDIWGDDADEFNPDRFLKDGESARTKMFWCTFLFGPRGCIGQRFALLEIKAFVAQILVRQRVSVKPMLDPPAGILGPFCTPKDMKLYFEDRNRP